MPRSAAVAAQVMEGFHLHMEAPEVEALVLAAVQRGRLEGLKDAQKLVSREWPQGQYDRFNEHSLSRNLTRAIRTAEAKVTPEPTPTDEEQN